MAVTSVTFQPMNWKGGSTISGDTVSCPIDPKATRQPLPKNSIGSCNVQYKFLYDEFWVWGSGYAGSGYGQSDGGLLQQFRGCGSLTDSSSYGLRSDSRERTIQGKVLIGKARSVGSVIGSADDPQGVQCSGDGAQQV